MKQSTFHVAKEAEYLGYLEANMSNEYDYNEEALFSKAKKVKSGLISKKRAVLGALGGVGVGAGSVGTYLSKKLATVANELERVTNLNNLSLAQLKNLHEDLLKNQHDLAKAFRENMPAFGQGHYVKTFNKVRDALDKRLEEVTHLIELHGGTV